MKLLVVYYLNVKYICFFFFEMRKVPETLWRNTKKDLLHIISLSDAPFRYKLKASTIFFLKLLGIRKRNNSL